jgi:type III pantothenate kinase
VLLAIDVGNTETKVALIREEEFVEHWRLGTDREETADEITVRLAGLLALRGLELSEVDGAVVSSVVPQLLHEYEEVSERYLRGALMLVRPGLKTGMSIRMENPHELGADRLLNAVAAYEQVGSACVVVDFGTSINYDVVSAEGEYLGGVLAPGVEISMDALAERAARLPKVSFERPEAVIGRSTLSALHSGLAYGFAGQVDGIVSRIREELSDEAVAIATGGLGPAIAPFCDQIDEVDELLTLKGLRLIWERNRH